MAITLGTNVRDKITGFEGIATARTEWLFGSPRIGVEAAEMRQGKPIEMQWFEEARMEEVSK